MMFAIVRSKPRGASCAASVNGAHNAVMTIQRSIRIMVGRN